MLPSTARSWRMLGMLFAAGISTIASRAAVAQPARAITDVTYATVDGQALRLDLAMPAGVPAPALLVWVHGGAWRDGTKASVPRQFAEHGIATASLDFRQSTDARFPAMVHDIKAAIRFLRANAGRYGYRADRIAIGGNSSGAHLAALVGVTNGDARLEGTVGDALSQSSSVQTRRTSFRGRTRRWGSTCRSTWCTARHMVATCSSCPSISIECSPSCIAPSDHD